MSSITDHLPGVKVSGQPQGGAVDRARKEREQRENSLRQAALVRAAIRLHSRKLRKFPEQGSEPQPLQTTRS